MSGRLTDWPQRLDAAIAAARRTPFVWGRFDCCLFPADGVLAMTGTDPLRAFRGAYAGEAAARALIAARFGDLETAAVAQARAAGLPEIPVLTAQRGDVVLADLRPLGVLYAPCLGLVGLAGRAMFARAPRGLCEFPLRACRRAWRV